MLIVCHCAAALPLRFVILAVSEEGGDKLQALLQTCYRIYLTSSVSSDANAPALRDVPSS